MNWKYSGQQHLAYNTNKTKKDTVTCSCPVCSKVFESRNFGSNIIAILKPRKK